MRLLVTGAAGQLGRRVLQQLAGDHDIVAFDRADPPADLPDRVHYVQADLRDAERVRDAARNAEGVIHLGAIPGRVPSIPDAEIFAINVQGTYHVLEAAARVHARIVVVASSLCAIGFPVSTEGHGLSYLPIDENHPCRPRHAYDLSKLLNERTAEMFSRLTGMATICLRLPALVEVRTSPWFPIELRREPPRLVLGDYLDFADAVGVIDSALASTELRHEVLFATAETLGSPHPTPEYIKRFKPPLEWRGDPPGNTTPLINCARAKRLLKFTPTITWQQGMMDTR